MGSSTASLAAQSRAAARMTSSGASRPVQMRKESAPCWTRTSIPSTTVAPAAAAAASRRVGSLAVDHVDHGLAGGEAAAAQRQLLEGVLAAQADRGGVDDQLVVALGRGRPTGSPAQLLAEVAGAQLGAVPDLDLGALADQRPDARRGRRRRRRAPAPGARRARPAARPAGRRRRCCRRGSRRRRRPACWRRRSRAPSRRARRRRASAAPLWGTVTLAPAKPSPGIARTRASKASGATSIAS